MGDRAALFFDRRWDELTKEFNFRTHVSEIYVPPSLHKAYLKAYHRIDAMQRKTQDVIDDEEHKLIIEEGRDFFKLPHTHFLRKELDNLRLSLDSFNPYHAVPHKNGHIRLADNQISGFFKVLSEGFDVVHNSFDMFRHSDYFKLFRHLRDIQKMPYQGPTSIYEIVNAYFGIAYSCSEQNKFYKNAINERYEKLEIKVLEAVAQKSPVIEVSPQGVRLLQNDPAPR